MEHTAAWGGPFEFQLAETNWSTSTEEGPAGDAQAWAAPAATYPLEYASIVDIFGSSCSLQPYVVPASSSSSGGQQQLVEYNYYAAAAEYKDLTGKGMATTHEDLSLSDQQIESYRKSPEKMFQERQVEFDKTYSAEFLKQKMHRYPPSIRALDDDGLYTVPRVVAIGPYHHYGGDHLKEAEQVKHAAAGHCIDISGLKVQDMYQVVVSAAAKINACGLYDKDVMEGMGYEDEFLPMMFFDACFLVVYMLKKTDTTVNTPLFNFLESKENDIAHDIMLLENQIPWPVVDAVMKCMRNPLATVKSFIAYYKGGFMQDQVILSPHVDWDEDYQALHLLGLLRFYVVGKITRIRESKLPPLDLDRIKSLQIFPSAIELAEIGVFLTANETTVELPADMFLEKKWFIFGKLSMVPLSFNDLRANSLFNMAALELCSTLNFLDVKARYEDSAVCSYLRLLCMLLHREEDVHHLRRKGILQGIRVTEKKTLDFFTNFQSLPRGRCFAKLMEQIHDYRSTRAKSWSWWPQLYKFIYNNRKTIAGIISVVGTVVSIIVTLKSAH